MAKDATGKDKAGGRLLLAGTVRESIVDGPGIRYVVFAQGCPHHCAGCHNPATHPLEGGVLTDIDALLTDIRSNPLLDGITLSGGEPFEQAREFARLARGAKALGLDVWVYTGYTHEILCSRAEEREGWADLLAQTDVLVDGPFILAQKDSRLRFKGSGNQRIIELKPKGAPEPADRMPRQSRSSQGTAPKKSPSAGGAVGLE